LGPQGPHNPEIILYKINKMFVLNKSKRSRDAGGGGPDAIAGKPAPTRSVTPHSTVAWIGGHPLSYLNALPPRLGYTFPVDLVSSQKEPAMSALHSMLIPVIAGLSLLTVGFGLRERDLGVLMMWLGTLGIFGIMCWKILEKLA
jgi:hypothetical protein